MKSLAPLLFACCLAVPHVARGAPDPEDFAAVARGRAMVVAGDCQACHTEAEGQPFAGGRAIETPFGTVRSSNITPDRATGIGAWNEQDFIDVLQKGRGRDGMHIYPAMPYTYTARVSREDARAMWAYLNTIPAVRHKVDADTLPFPLDIRAVLGVWNLLFFREGAFKPDPARSAEWNRGAYLVEGVEHCGMCHTPKNLLGGDERGRTLQGYALQGWFAPNITDDARRGLGQWSVDDIVAYLGTGHNRFAGASGPMAEEVAMSSSHEPPADLRAIAVYLKSQPGQGPDEGGGRAIPLDANTPAMRAGAAIYADECSACHTPDGRGVAGLFPALRQSAAVQSVRPDSVVRVILRGARRRPWPPTSAMAGAMRRLPSPRPRSGPRVCGLRRAPTIRTERQLSVTGGNPPADRHPTGRRQPPRARGHAGRRSGWPDGRRGR